jgi:hypothetical protein
MHFTGAFAPHAAQFFPARFPFVHFDDFNSRRSLWALLPTVLGAAAVSKKRMAGMTASVLSSCAERTPEREGENLRWESFGGDL